LIEKRGKKWAFTDFGVEIWGATASENGNSLKSES
jgi:hypothetical protein